MFLTFDCNLIPTKRFSRYFLFFFVMSAAQPQETSPTAQPFKMVATMLSASPTWYLSVGDTVEINCTTLYDFGNNSHVINMQLFWTKFGSDNTTKTVRSCCVHFIVHSERGQT